LNQRSLKEPPRLIYGLLRWLVSVYCHVVLGLRVHERQELPKEGPVFLLCSHQGMLDFLLVFAAARGRRLHFVASHRYFQNPILGRLLRWFGVISKVQFHPDPRCIGSMLRVVKNGGAVCLFPAGQTSMCGVPTVISPSAVKLLRKSGATIVGLRLHGGFFSKPRFGKTSLGKCHAEFRTLLTPEQLAQSDDSTIYHTICRGLDFNEYAWQQATRARFIGFSRAAGYSKILYHCPHCGSQDCIEDRGNRVWCTACGNILKVGTDMRLYPADKQSTAVFPTLLEWYQWQEEQVISALEQDEGFHITAPVTAWLHRGKGPEECGSGIIRLDREGLFFEGIVDGQTVQLALNHANLPGLSLEESDFLVLPVDGMDLVRFQPPRPGMLIRWKIAQEYLYSKTITL